MISPASDQGRHVRHILAGVAIITPLITLVFAESPLGQRLENALYDFWFNLRGEIEKPEEIALVAIDIESEDSLDRYPWKRTWHAKLIRNLARAGVKVVGFDATFADEFPEDDRILMEAIEETGITVLGVKTATTVKREGFSIELEEPATNLSEAPYGVVDINIDKVDGVVREYPMLHEYPVLLDNFEQGVVTVPQLGIEVLRRYLDLPETGSFEVTRKGWRLGDIAIPRGPDGGMLINYIGFRGSVSTYSYASIVDDADTWIGDDWDMDVFEDLLVEGRLEGKMVLVGSTIPESHDLRRTTFINESGTTGAQLTPGVEIHAHAIDTILKRRFIHVVPLWINYLLILVASVGVTFLTAQLKARLGGVIGIVITGSLLVTAWIMFRMFSTWMWVVSPVVGAALAYSGSTVALYLAEQQEKARIRGMFQQYVAPTVVNELIAHPELLALGGEERELTVLFCDVAGFTGISENLSPTELVRLLNEYLTEMTEIVLSYKGIIDKYQGDAMMAEFGAPVPFPDHALRGCKAALEMQRTLARMREEWAAEDRAELHSRIGLNTGTMLVGNLGSHHIMDYTVMGDNVNLASRLEGANKAYGTNICISEMTYEHCQGEMICRELDLIRVKGKTQPVRIFEVIETTDMGVPAGLASLLERYEFGLMLYRNREFGDALDIFNEIVQMDPEDGPSRMCKVRCEQYLSNPPPDDWDGVFTMTTK